MKNISTQDLYCTVMPDLRVVTRGSSKEVIARLNVENERRSVIMCDDDMPLKLRMFTFRNERFEWTKQTKKSKNVIAELKRKRFSFNEVGTVKLLEGKRDMYDYIIVTAVFLLCESSDVDVLELVRVSGVQETPPQLALATDFVCSCAI